MKLKMMLAVAAIVALSGCASVPQAADCSDSYRASLETRRVELVKERDELVAMQAKPGAMLMAQMGVIATNEDRKYFSAQSFNERLGRLKQEAEQFNKVCAKQS